MSVDVALIDFPRLQEQIATRLLSNYDVRTHRMLYAEAAAQMEMFHLAFFFWSEVNEESLKQLQEIKKATAPKPVPIILVMSGTHRHHAEALLGDDSPDDIIVTPLRQYEMLRQLSKLLGVQAAPAPARLDVVYVNPFVEATTNTLKQMGGILCQRTGLMLRTDARAQGEISGTMGLSGAAEGFVALTLHPTLAQRLVAAMLQMKESEVGEEDIRDGIGEMMNMIAEQARAELANTEHEFQLSLPTVIVGGSHSVGQSRGVPVMVIQFEADSEPFEVMVCLQPKRK